jgi:phage terminase small subunit
MSLSNLQREFINQYFLCGRNATEAAIRAGYKCKNRVVAASIGFENLRKPQISEAIEARMEESAMSAAEVLYLLSEHARGNLNDFLDKCGNPDLNKARARGKMHLVKKFKTKVTTIKDVVTVEKEIELHDPQSALVQLGRFHKLFTDKVEVNDWRGEAIAAIRGNEVDYEALADELGENLAITLFREAGVPVPS